MQSVNNTLFPCVAWENVNNAKESYLTSLCRVKYRLQPLKNQTEQWELRLTPDQGELFGGDVFYEDDHLLKPVRYESDFVIYKANTDIILNAKAHSPNRSKMDHWQCAASVFSPDKRLIKTSSLKVCGERTWTHTPLGWAKTSLQAVNAVSLGYQASEGGCIVDKEADGGPEILAIDPENPVGTGIKHRKMDTADFPVYQVEWAKPKLVFKRYPAGFGFINRAWPIRLSKAGTYDETWLAEQHPYPPFDFNFEYHQAANPELILDGFIELNSQFVLENLFAGHPKVSLRIPELYCFAEIKDNLGNTTRHRMNIDTVLFDIESDKADEHCVYLSYRHYQLINTPVHSIAFLYLPPNEWLKKSSLHANKNEAHNG